MPLANDAHIRLTAGSTSYDFMLDPAPVGQGPSYRHYYTMLVRSPYSSYVIEGTNDTNLNRELFFWEMTDWTGGEGEGQTGTIQWSPDDPIVYDSFNGNPRIPGQITAAPTRTDATVRGSLSATLGTRCFLAYAGGYLWAGFNDGSAAPAHISYTSDLVTWTSVDPVGKADGTDVPSSTAFFITGMVGKGDNVYVSLSESINMSPGGLHLRRINTGANDLFSEAASAHDTKGMAAIQGYLYRWTSQKLSQYDTTQDLPLIGVIVYSAGIDVSTATSYADAVSTDTSIVMMQSKAGFTEVHEFRDGVGVPIWSLPQGFTGRVMGHLLGTVYVAGTYNNSAALFALSLGSRQPFFVGYLRRGVTLTPVSLAPGMGAQLLIGTAEGYVFIYDAERDAISLLDYVTGNGDALAAVGTFSDQRVAAFRYAAGSSFRSSSWATDTDIPVTATYTMDSGEFDLAMPMEPKKVLHGIHVQSSSLSAHSTVEVQYAVGAGGFVSAGTLTSGTDSYLPVSTSSSTVTGALFRIKTIGTSTSGASAPVVKRVVPRFENLNWREEWDVAVLINDTMHPSDNDPRPQDVRTWLRSLMTNRTLVAFLDGTRSAANEDPPTSGAVTCILKDMQDTSDGFGVGTCLLTLANVSVT